MASTSARSAMARFGVCEIDLRSDTGIDAVEPGVCVLKKLPGVDSGMQRLTFSPVGAKIRRNVAVQPVYVFDAKTG